MSELPKKIDNPAADCKREREARRGDDVDCHAHSLLSEFAPRTAEESARHVQKRAHLSNEPATILDPEHSRRVDPQVARNSPSSARRGRNRSSKPNGPAIRFCYLPNASASSNHVTYS